MVDQCLLAQSDYTGLHFFSVNLFSESDSFHTGYILGSDDVVALAFGINTTLLTDEGHHGLESRAVGRHDNDVFVRTDSAGDGRKLGEGTQQDRLMCQLTGKRLHPHHKPAITGNSHDFLIFSEVPNCFFEFCQNLRVIFQ